jgi:hypothetical protein
MTDITTNKNKYRCQGELLYNMINRNVWQAKIWEGTF